MSAAVVCRVRLGQLDAGARFAFVPGGTVIQGRVEGPGEAGGVLVRLRERGRYIEPVEWSAVIEVEVAS